MERIFKCISSFTLPAYDDDGFELDSVPELEVKENTLYKLYDKRHNILNHDCNHLKLISRDNEQWIEISDERFNACFEEINNKTNDDFNN